MACLTQLHDDIDNRVHNILHDHPDWLCRKGCDHCCRQLANIPQLTPAEWALLKEGLQSLPAQQLREVASRLNNLPSSRPFTCPMLELATGTCPVYAQRPVACRTYGFYIQRDQGLYCTDIESQTDEGKWDGVVWGNQDVIDRQLGSLGPSRALNDWFHHWIAETEQNSTR